MEELLEMVGTCAIANTFMMSAPPGRSDFVAEIHELNKKFILRIQKFSH